MKRWTVAVLLLVWFGVVAGPSAAGANTPGRPAAVTAQVPSQTEGEQTGARTNRWGMIEYGPIPIANYEIGCDEGAVNQIIRKMLCLFEMLPFTLGKYLVPLGNTLVAWALDLDAAGWLSGQVVAMSGGYNTTVVAGLQLKHFAWSIASFYVAWLLLRRRTSHAAGEVMMSLLTAVLGGFLIANPAGYMTGLLDTMNATNATIVQSVSGDTDMSTTSFAAAAGTQMEQSFVAAPFDLVNWGGPLTGDCAVVRTLMLMAGPQGNADEPRNAMKNAGCEAAANFNHDPSMERVFASIMMSVGSALLMVLQLVIAVVLLVAQFILVPVWALTPVVLTLAIAPGPFRQLGTWWLGASIAAFGATLAASLTLTFVAGSTSWALQMGDASILKRMVFMDVMVASGFVIRKRIAALAKSASQRLASRLAEATPGRTSTGSWVSRAGIHEQKMHRQLDQVSPGLGRAAQRQGKQAQAKVNATMRKATRVGRSRPQSSQRLRTNR